MFMLCPPPRFFNACCLFAPRYSAVRASCGGLATCKAVVDLGEKELIETGVPKLKARKVWQRAHDIVHGPSPEELARLAKEKADKEKADAEAARRAKEKSDADKADADRKVAEKAAAAAKAIEDRKAAAQEAEAAEARRLAAEKAAAEKERADAAAFAK